MCMPLLALQLHSPSEAITFHYSGDFWSNLTYTKGACTSLSFFLSVFGINFEYRMII